jgi:hypothetical protein
MPVFSTNLRKRLIVNHAASHERIKTIAKEIISADSPPLINERVS